MNLIQSISSTLKTWVFKKKLLKFSGRFRQDPEACFYCPEMCRFSCPTAETLRTNTATPRGKMSLLHLAEQGYLAEQVAGSEETRLYFLEQCTGCGRCTEFCVYENDVGSHLRNERAVYFKKTLEPSNIEALLDHLRALEGKVLFCEPSRKIWWDTHPELVKKLGVSCVSDAEFPHIEWGWGKLPENQTESIGVALSKCNEICVESAELGWFFVKGVKEERKVLQAEVRTVWQKFFSEFAALEFSPDVVFHESSYFSRLFPRLGISIPMYERGFMPFHRGWNVWDCGGEGFYRHAHPKNAQEMGVRFLADLQKDGRTIAKIVCQNLSCLSHLSGQTGARVVYWLDEVFHE